jgi:hypothetical protein
MRLKQYAYFIFHLGHKIKNEQTGFYAAILYTASIYTSLIAGVFIIPDTPQLFFWIGAIYIMVDVLPDKGTSALHQKRFLPGLMQIDRAFSMIFSVVR